MDRTMRERDGRNPYGRRGGYTDRGSRRMGRTQGRMENISRGEYPMISDKAGRGRDRDYADYRDYRDRGDMREDYGDYRDYGERDYADYNDYNDYRDYRDYRDSRDYGDYRDYRDYRDYGDYASGSKLKPQEINEWIGKLMQEIGERDNESLKKEMVMKLAESSGVKFENYTPEEFYVTVLMEYSDYKKTIGPSNMAVFVRMAKDFLEDKDSKVKYGEKLAGYYDLVMGM